MRIARILGFGLIGWSAACSLQADGTRLDLVGLVLQEGGSPVTNGTVFIYTAGPRVGSGVVCPSCYADCGKKSKLSPEGRFAIDSLSPNLLFRLLVVAPGYESKFAPKTDPAKGEVKITLARLSEQKLKSPTRILGMVMDQDGLPLAGATVSPEGVARGSGTQWGGTDSYVDPLAVTDETGKFWLFCTNNVERVHAVVEGQGVAKRWVELAPGRDHLIRMQEGVTVTASVVDGGKPVTNALLGLVTKERTCGLYLNCDELATDKNGLFLMPNAPPGREFVLYAKMGSLPGDGTIEARTFTVGATGTKLDVGQLEVKTAHRLAGRVVLSDGKPIPANTRLLLGRQDAWDHAEATLEADGSFEFRGVPAESVGLNLRIPGYKFSKRNASLDWLNGGLVGRVDRDILDLFLLMEPGQWRYNGEETDAPSGESQPRDKPLRGAKPVS
jgi:hypothetical protein